MDTVPGGYRAAISRPATARPFSRVGGSTGTLVGANLLGVEMLDIEIDHTPGRGWFTAGGKVEVRVSQPVPDQETVTCVIPGHHRTGRELISDSIKVDAGPLVFSVAGRCAYESTFAYSSDDQ